MTDSSSVQVASTGLLPSAADFAAFGVDDFVRLLRERLSQLRSLDPVQRRRAMDFTEDDISLAPLTPLEALPRLARRMPSAAASRLRTALGEVLAQAHPTWVDGETMALLITLVAATQAHEALDPMVAAIADGGRWGEFHPTLYVDALSTLKGMGGGQAILNAGRRLALKSDLPARFAFDACQVLLAGSASTWATQFLDLVPKLIEVVDYQPGGRQVKGQSWFTSRMLGFVERSVARLTLQTVAKGLVELQGGGGLPTRQLARVSAERLAVGHPVGLLLHAMFAGGHSPFIRISDAARGTTFGLRQAPLLREPWPDHLGFVERRLGEWGARALHLDELPITRKAPPTRPKSSPARAGAQSTGLAQLLDRQLHLPDWQPA